MKTITIVLLLLLSFTTCMAQEAVGGKPKRMTLKERRHIADSLRLELRHAANEGRMLQWGDSLLHSRLDSGTISKRRFRKLQRRLHAYDRTLFRGDSLLARKYGKITYDTAYITRPAGRWTIKFRGNLSGSLINAEGKQQGIPFESEVKSDYRGTMSVAVSYRGVSLGLAINPAKLAGKSKDNEFNLNSYGNKFGFDIVYLSSKTFKGYSKSNGIKSDIDKGSVSQEALNINAYYAFNGRKFSYPAAFSQSYIQRRSAGSFLLGASLDAQTTKIDGSLATSGNNLKLKVVEFAIGAGYGYNLVAGKHWLFHLSAVPTFDVFIRSHMTSGGERVRMHYDFPSLIITGRGAAVYSWRNKFAGASMVLNYSGFGNEDRLYLRRNKWRLRLFYGFRF